MADISLSVSSTEYVPGPTTATLNGKNYDPTGDSVAFDFEVSPTQSNPTRSWITGTWEPVGPRYKAILLVRPSGTVTLAAATYDIWMKITDNPEAPVRKVGTLAVTNP